MTVKKYLAALNGIEDLVENPCDGDWWLYVKTFFPALGDAFYVLLIPSPDEILEEYLDPTTTRARGKRFPRIFNRNKDIPGGGKRRGRLSGLLDVDGTIADRIPGRKLLATRKISATEFVLWGAFNALERGLFYWQLVDLSADFILNWQSGIMSTACKFPWLPVRGRWTGSKQPAGADSFPLVQGAWQEDYLENASYESGQTVVFPGYYSLSLFCSIQLWSDFTGDSILRGVSVSVRVKGGIVKQHYADVVVPRPGNVWASLAVFERQAYQFTIHVDDIPSGGNTGHVAFLAHPEGD